MKQQATKKLILPKDRSFGLFFATIMLALFAWNVLFYQNYLWWLFGLSAFIGLASLSFPQLLRPFNLTWFYIGYVLHKITNPIIMTFIFYGIITPIAICRRIFQKPSFEKKIDRNTESYWIKRIPPGPEKQSLFNQF